MFVLSASICLPSASVCLPSASICLCASIRLYVFLQISCLDKGIKYEEDTLNKCCAVFFLFSAFVLDHLELFQTVSEAGFQHSHQLLGAVSEVCFWRMFAILHDKQKGHKSDSKWKLVHFAMFPSLN